MKKWKQAKRRGALSVEVAICAPILFLFLFACYEVAHANMLKHATESAAYEAARVGIVPGAKRRQVKAAAAGVLRTVGIENFRITISPRNIKSSTEKIKVELEVPFRKNSSVPKLFIRNPVFKGQCQLSRESL